ncbi:MAG: hypothetical protein M1831_003021 [Alyxoria varia]|nr:MAG: hypothetical protein M1831_003021 [Alyxoria varia]
MSRPAHIPDAWDDDFESIADSNKSSAPPPQSKPSQPQPRVSRAERKAKHAEANKAIWESAENKGNNFHFVDAMRNDNVPLKTEFKPAIKVLARKPKHEQQPKRHSRGKSTGLETRVDGLFLHEDEEDMDSEEEERREREKNFAKRKEEAEKTREEKNRKYEEVRARIFKGEQSYPASAGNSGRNSPRSASPWPERTSSSKPRNLPAGGVGRSSSNNNNTKESNISSAAPMQEPPSSSDPSGMKQDRSMSTSGLNEGSPNNAQLRSSNPNSSNKDIETKSSSTSNLKDVQPSQGTSSPPSGSQSPPSKGSGLPRGLDPNISIKPNASFSEMHAGLMDATRRKSQTDQQIRDGKSPPA